MDREEGELPPSGGATPELSLSYIIFKKISRGVIIISSISWVMIKFRPMILIKQIILNALPMSIHCLLSTYITKSHWHNLSLFLHYSKSKKVEIWNIDSSWDLNVRKERIFQTATGKPATDENSNNTISTFFRNGPSENWLWCAIRNIDQNSGRGQDIK